MSPDPEESSQALGNDGLNPDGDSGRPPWEGPEAPGGEPALRGFEEDDEGPDSNSRVENVVAAFEEPAREAVARPAWLADLPYWAVSAALHLVLFLILLTFVIEKRERTSPAKELAFHAAPQLPDYDPTLERDVKKTPKIVARKKVELPVIQRKIEEVTIDIPKGTDLSNLSNVELYSRMVNDAIGMSGGAAGAYGERWGKGALVREGGSTGSEEAVRAALEWLRRHQSRDGGWRARDFLAECETPCRNRNPKLGDGRGPPEYDVGVTALAMLAFAGYGHTHRFGVFPEYVECLEKAVEYMKRVQAKTHDPRERGRYGGTGGHWPYNHSIATMAMAELLIMSGDVLGLKRSVKEAVELILYMRNPREAWRYGVRDGDNDMSVTGWMVLALKTAKNARLGIPAEEFDEAFEGALAFLNAITNRRGRTVYTRLGEQRGPLPCMTSVGVLCRLFAGESRASEAVRQGVDICMVDLPKWDEGQRERINIYHWYYGSYALFQFGGEPWQRWNVSMQEALLKTQRRGGDEDGSWDPIGYWGPRGGRVYSTALGAMTLEVYYRFRRAREGVGF